MKPKALAGCCVTILAILTLRPSFRAESRGVAQNDFIEIRVDDPRPLASVTQELEWRYGWIVTYEDPRHEYSGDIQDVTQ